MPKEQYVQQTGVHFAVPENPGVYDPNIAPNAVAIVQARREAKFNENKKEEDLFIQNWILHLYERVSINVISWRGDEFAKFGGNVGRDEELWLSSEYPSQINRPNKIIGDTLFIHYAFFPQRSHLEETDILEKYKSIVNGK